MHYIFYSFKKTDYALNGSHFIDLYALFLLFAFWIAEKWFSINFETNPIIIAMD